MHQTDQHTLTNDDPLAFCCQPPCLSNCSLGCVCHAKLALTPCHLCCLFHFLQRLDCIFQRLLCFGKSAFYRGHLPLSLLPYIRLSENLAIVACCAEGNGYSNLAV